MTATKGDDDVCEYDLDAKERRFGILTPPAHESQGGTEEPENAPETTSINGTIHPAEEPVESHAAWIARAVQEAKKTLRPEDVERISAEILQDEHFFSDCEDRDH